MLWPGRTDGAIQIIDVRDLANFVVDAIEQGITGTYNTVTPSGSYTIGDLANDCLAVTGAEMKPTWVSAEFIDAQKLNMPIWSPPTGEYAAVPFVNGEKAAAEGLKNRPVRETARDLIAWWKTLPAKRTRGIRAGPSSEREARALAQWHKA